MAMFYPARILTSHLFMFQQSEKPSIWYMLNKLIDFNSGRHNQWAVTKSSSTEDSREKIERKHRVENHLQSWDEFPSLKTLGDKVSSNFQDTARMSEPVPMFQLVSPVATTKTEQSKSKSKSCPAEKWITRIWRIGLQTLRRVKKVGGIES